jgi:preprotein translocase subunit SecD
MERNGLCCPLRAPYARIRSSDGRKNRKRRFVRQMSAEKRIQNWILVAAVLILAIAVPLFKVSRDEPAVKQGIDLVGGVDLLLEAKVPQGEEKITQDMMLGAIDILRNRLDPEGVKEIILQQMGEDRIVVQIPGEDDPERVKRMIGATASLKFIDAGNDPIPEGTRVRYIDAVTGQPLEGIQALEEEEEEPQVEPQVSTVMPDQVLFKPEDLLGFMMEPVWDEGEERAEGTPPREEIALVLQDAPAGVNLAVQTTQHQGDYLVLLIDSLVRATHLITQPLTSHAILFPDLSQDPTYTIEWLDSNLQRMKVVRLDVKPETGTRIEEFSLTGEEGGGAEEETETPGRIDITTDKIVLTGDDFADADVHFGQLGQPMIGFRFKPGGREIFGRFTRQHVQQYLAIALDDIIISCPVIKEPILGGNGVIEGSFSLQEAQELVIKLDSGRLPVPLEVIENRTVGPTLGEKSIADSKRAGILGAILVLLFMVLYYRLPGFTADVALLFYMVVFFGALSVLNATLTLPGIAGFIMSVGMAVDANVIIFERLKEELKTGKTFRSASEAAFKRAFVAIFDSNVTTLITAIVLYNLGTGPIRGFAVTLSLGILVSMFSALVLTRLLLEGLLGYRRFQKYPLFGLREADIAVAGRGGEA